MKKDDINKVCSHCNSSDIKMDAFVVWNKTNQEFELFDIYENDVFCNKCQGECIFKNVNITENYLIARFMGHEIKTDGSNLDYIDWAGTEYAQTRSQYGDLKYHIEWNWLLPVVNKILTIITPRHEYYELLKEALWSITIEEVYPIVVKIVKQYTNGGK